MTKAEALNLINAEYRRLDRICNVDTSGVEISLSTRMTRQLGCFAFKKSPAGEKLSVRISDKIINDEGLFLDVVRHEYAHAIVHIRHPHARHAHDDVWKAACVEVGCEPKATRKIKGYTSGRKSRPVKYIVRCRSCRSESGYRAEGKVVKILLRKMPGRVICRKCGSDDFEIMVVRR